MFSIFLLILIALSLLLLNRTFEKNIFATFPLGCAARSRSLLVSSLPPGSSEIIYGNVVLESSITFSGNLTVFGSVQISSASLSATAILTVFGSVNLTGQLTLTSGAVLSTDRLNLEPGASLVVVVPFFPAPLTTTTVVVASYTTSATGSLTSVTAVSSSESSPSCGTVTSTPNYGTSSLSVTVATSACGGGLSTGALVGIIVGAVIGGLLIGLGVVLLIRFLGKRQENKMRMRLANETKDSMNYELRKMKEY